MSTKPPVPPRFLELAEKLRSMLPPLPQGEERAVYFCHDCQNVYAHDFIPYALGGGRWYNPCNCRVTNNCRWERQSQITEEMTHGQKAA